jgi:hypothetical protein
MLLHQPVMLLQVKPVLGRLTRTLQATGAGLAAATLALVLMQGEQPAGFVDATGDNARERFWDSVQPHL